MAPTSWGPIALFVGVSDKRTSLSDPRVCQIHPDERGMNLNQISTKGKRAMKAKAETEKSATAAGAFTGEKVEERIDSKKGLKDTLEQGRRRHP